MRVLFYLYENGVNKMIAKENDISLLMKERTKDIIDNMEDIDDILEVVKFLNAKQNNKKEREKISRKDILNSFSIHLDAEGKKKSTIENYSVEAKRLLEYFKTKEIDLKFLDHHIVEEYLAIQRKIRNLNINAYSKVVVIIRVFIKYLNSKKIIDIEISKIKVPKRVKPIREYLSKQDEEKIKEYINNREERYKNENLRDMIIYYLGVNCGLRKSEILNIKWDNIDLKNSQIRIRKSKGEKDRKIPIGKNLFFLLSKYRKKTKNYKGPVIKGSFGKKINSNSLQNIVRRMFKESGVYRKNLCTHSLRHTFAEKHRKKGTDIATLSKLMEHSSIATTEAYLHVTNDDINKVVID